MNTTTKNQMSTYSATSDVTGEVFTFNAKRDWTGSFAVIVTTEDGEGIYGRHGKRAAAMKNAASLAGNSVFTNVHVVVIEAA